MYTLMRGGGVKVDDAVPFIVCNVWIRLWSTFRTDWIYQAKFHFSSKWKQTYRRCCHRCSIPLTGTIQNNLGLFITLFFCNSENSDYVVENTEPDVISNHLYVYWFWTMFITCRTSISLCIVFFLNKFIYLNKINNLFK